MLGEGRLNELEVTGGVETLGDEDVVSRARVGGCVEGANRNEPIYKRV
jgi:hypothetical protein